MSQYNNFKEMMVTVKGSFKRAPLLLTLAEFKIASGLGYTEVLW